MPVPTLMQWGPLQFQVWPLNFHELDHATETEWARKDVIDSSPQRENVGEGDEIINVRGRIFPHHRIGGWQQLEQFEAMRRAGQANQLIRGGNNMGVVLGWFVCERLNRNHTSIGPDGIGKVVTFEAQFARADIPLPGEYLANIFSVTVGRA